MAGRQRQLENRERQKVLIRPKQSKAQRRVSKKGGEMSGAGAVGVAEERVIGKKGKTTNGKQQTKTM